MEVTGRILEQAVLSSGLLIVFTSILEPCSAC